MVARAKAAVLPTFLTRISLIYPFSFRVDKPVTLFFES
jgi:hypothetical protein